MRSSPHAGRSRTRTTGPAKSGAGDLRPHLSSIDALVLAATLAEVHIARASPRPAERRRIWLRHADVRGPGAARTRSSRTFRGRQARHRRRPGRRRHPGQHVRVPGRTAEGALHARPRTAAGRRAVTYSDGSRPSAGPVPPLRRGLQAARTARRAGPRRPGPPAGQRPSARRRRRHRAHLRSGSGLRSLRSPWSTRSWAWPSWPRSCSTPRTDCRAATATPSGCGASSSTRAHAARPLGRSYVPDRALPRTAGSCHGRHALARPRNMAVDDFAGSRALLARPPSARTPRKTLSYRSILYPGCPWRPGAGFRRIRWLPESVGFINSGPPDGDAPLDSPSGSPGTAQESSRCARVSRQKHQRGTTSCVLHPRSD